MRKSFTGDREEGAKYYGLARTRLAELKQTMALGGLSQLMRAFTLPGGVEITVASTFGQDYIAVHAPPLDASIVAERAQEEADADAARIGRYIEATFADTVRRTGSVGLQITRPQPDLVQSPEVLTGGNEEDGSFYLSTATGFQKITKVRGYVNSSVRGRVATLKGPFGSAGFELHSFTSDGRYAGANLYTHEVRNPFDGKLTMYGIHRRATLHGGFELNLSNLGVSTSGEDSVATAIGGTTAGLSELYGTYTGGLFRHIPFAGASKVSSIPPSVMSISVPRPNIPQPDVTTYLTYPA